MGKRMLSAEDVAKHGIVMSHELMDNGELRFRLKASDGTGYIRTEAGKNGQWQSSHFHKTTREIYIVQRSWMCMAIYDNGKLTLRIYHEGEYTEVEPMTAHNVFLPEGAITHTVKFGNADAEDWRFFPELDPMTRGLSEEDIKRKCG